MAFEVRFTKSAQKEFNFLSAKIQTKVIDAVTVLAQNPYSELLRVKKLKSQVDLYRIRIGDYRVVYEIKNEVLLILVIKIGHRSDVYRNL